MKVEERIQAARARILEASPFFGTLLLHLPHRLTEAFPLGATDGRWLYLNPRGIEELSERELDGLILHELLHAAYQHVPRREGRQHVRWNIAADIVVNGVLRHLEWVRLPRGSVHHPELEHLAVEEVYAALPEQPEMAGSLGLIDLQAPEAQEAETPEVSWEEALAQARLIARRFPGSLPRGLEREERALEPHLDWRSLLWRFVTSTPDDYQTFDRRFVHRGLYLETLEVERVRVALCIDTSGSIDEELLAAFLGELRGILEAYPHLEGLLFYADAELYGPFDLEHPPPPRGGGGTSFIPLFRYLEDDLFQPWVVIYLTDGEGIFPKTPPPFPVLWVVPRGTSVPFGEVLELPQEV